MTKIVTFKFVKLVGPNIIIMKGQAVDSSFE